MHELDTRFDNHTIELLQSLVGKNIDKTSYFLLAYTSSVYGMSVLQIEGRKYAITAYYEPLDYMGEGVDDVGVMRFREMTDEVLERYEEWIRSRQSVPDSPVGQKITEIRIVNENQKLYEDGKQFNNFYMVKGIVFVLEDGLEISFEKEGYDTEFITVNKGHDLIDGFASVDDEFVSYWREEVPEVTAEGSREIVVLK